MRFWEIDFARGIAVILMIIFNYSFALNYFNVYKAVDSWFFWFLFPRSIAAIFIFLVGVSLAISYSRNKSYKKYIIRGAKIFGYGMIVTAATWLLFPQYTIIFGILHLIGISIILSIFFAKSKNLLLLAVAFMLAGFYLSSFTFDFSWLLWLGLMPSGFQTFDYFPLFPWLGIILLGMHAGKKFYRGEKRKFGIREKPEGAEMFCFLGRHSLFIYFIHQPILVAILYLLGYGLL